ncbi:MAG: transcription antitermination factor NusB [Propionibacteriaceae bacterium]|nr:transcription antitermination factor NusB [Propionibacteriaceae bacterium]
MAGTDDLATIPLAAGERPPLPDAVKVEVISDGTQRHHSARTKARKAAVDVLYSAELAERDPLEVLNSADPPHRLLTCELVTGVVANQDDIDAVLAASFTGDWALERMPVLDRTLARLAVWELKFTDTAPSVVIAEAVALADEYSTDASAGFLSSVLGTIAANPDAEL